MSDEQLKSNRERVYTYIQTQINKGILLPGGVLDLKHIAQTLGVSNTPLRDGLFRLEAEGVLTIYPRSKVVINALELHDFPYLYAMMGSIEYTAISNSLDLYTEEHIEKLCTLNQGMRQAINDGEIVLYDRLHHAFHAVFFEVAPNLFAERILKPIKNRLWDFPRKNFHTKWYTNAIDEHDLIIENIKDKDKESLFHNIVHIHWGFEYNKESVINEYNFSLNTASPSD